MKKIGIWMDHYTAHCIIAEKGVIATIRNQHENRSRYTGEGANETQVAQLHLGSNEFQTNQTDNNTLKIYFQSLADFICNYQHILLFGPTAAKNEFLNTFVKDTCFADTLWHIEHSDQLTDNQMVAFVREFYSNIK